MVSGSSTQIPRPMSLLVISAIPLLLYLLTSQVFVFHESFKIPPFIPVPVARSNLIGKVTITLVAFLPYPRELIHRTMLVLLLALRYLPVLLLCKLQMPQNIIAFGDATFIPRGTFLVFIPSLVHAFTWAVFLPFP